MSIYVFLIKIALFPKKLDFQLNFNQIIQNQRHNEWKNYVVKIEVNAIEI